MSMTSPHVGAPPRRSLGLARILSIGSARHQARSRIHRDMAELSELPNHLLRDMGLEDHVSQRSRFWPRAWR